MNYIVYMAGDHNYMFDEESLVNTLKKAGFASVALREFDPQLDTRPHDYESICALAVK